MYILHTRQTCTLFTTTTSLSRTYEEDFDAIVRQKAYCTYRKTDSCRIFPLSLSSFVSIYIRIQTHQGERDTFFSPTVFLVLKCSQERGMTEPRQKSFEGFAFLAYEESLSLAFKSLLPLSSPSGLLSPDSWAASHSGAHSVAEWRLLVFTSLSHSLTHIVHMLYVSSFIFSFLLSLPSTCRSTFHSFFVSYLTSLWKRSLWEEKNRSREPLFLRNHQSSLSPPLPALFFRQVTDKKKRDEKPTRTSIWITSRNGSRMPLVSLTILYIYVVSFPHFYVFSVDGSFRIPHLKIILLAITPLHTSTTIRELNNVRTQQQAYSYPWLSPIYCK